MRLFNITRIKMAKAFLLCLFVFMSCGAMAEKHTDIRIGISQYPSTLHPFFDDMVAKSYVLGMSLRPVTVHDTNWKSVCMLCTELPSFENGLAKRKDKGISATYKIRDDAFWGDGTPVTVKDIIFAREVGMHPQSGVGNAEFFDKDIAGIDTVDDKTFTIRFAKEKCDFASINDFYPLPAHLERKLFEKDPATYRSRTFYNTDPANPGLYWGPYRIAKVEPGAALTLVRNAYWKGKTPAFDSITVKTIENSASLAANLLSGDIDYIAGELGIALDQALSFEKRLNALHPDDFSTTYKPGLTYEHIDLNLDTSMFKDKQVRQALMFGMNRQAINNTFFAGKQPIATTNINPLDEVYAQNTLTYPYDPKKAETLLEETGWKKGADGLRANAKGEKLSITILTTAGNKSRETILQAIIADWRKIGVDAKMETQSPRVLFGDTMRVRSFRGGAMYAWMSAPRNVPRTTLHSKMIPSAANNYAGQNYAGYASTTMDKTIDDLEIVCAPKENQALWAKLQSLYADDLPALPLYYRADAYFIPAWLKGLVPTGHMHPTTLWIENWTVSE